MVKVNKRSWWGARFADGVHLLPSYGKARDSRLTLRNHMFVIYSTYSAVVVQLNYLIIYSSRYEISLPLYLVLRGTLLHNHTLNYL
jgi:hypothetical protein